MTEIPADELSVHPQAYPLLGTFPSIRMRDIEVLQFGNKKNRTGTYESWYKEQGARTVVSIDWNGKDGALPLDCNEAIHYRHMDREQPFDLVTNFGFSEHVTDQRSFWENNHHLCTPRMGFMIGVTPAPGFWPRHGILQPTEEFYRALAEVNRYVVCKLDTYTKRERHTICYAFGKIEQRPFMMPNGWEDMIIPTPHPSQEALRHSRVK